PARVKGYALVIGRPGGPDFLPSEVEHLGRSGDIVGAILSLPPGSPPGPETSPSRARTHPSEAPRRPVPNRVAGAHRVGKRMAPLPRHPGGHRPTRDPAVSRVKSNAARVLRPNPLLGRSPNAHNHAIGDHMSNFT